MRSVETKPNMKEKEKRVQKTKFWEEFHAFWAPLSQPCICRDLNLEFRDQGPSPFDVCLRGQSPILKLSSCLKELFISHEAPMGST